MMPKKLRSKCHRGRQRQLKHVHAALPNAYQEGGSDRACFLAHQRQTNNGCRSVYRLASASAAAGTSAYMTCMVRTVLTIYVRQAQVHLSRLPLSATKASLSKLLLIVTQGIVVIVMCVITCVPPSTRRVRRLAMATCRRD